MERRKHTNRDDIPAALPIDYVKMIKSVFTSSFQKGLIEFGKHQKKPYFEAKGAIFPEEVILSVTLLSEKKLSANTVHASCDFNPKKKPTAEVLLNSCVDAIGAVFGGFLLSEDPERIEDLAKDSLSAMKNASPQWELVEINKHKVYIKMDKSNPYLDSIADNFLKKHAPPQAAEPSESESEDEK